VKSTSDGLLRAVTEIALEVQRADSVADMLTVAGAGLEGLGFDVAVLALVAGKAALPYLSKREPLLTLARLLDLERQAAVLLPSVKEARTREEAALLADLPAAVQTWLQLLGTTADLGGLAAQLRKRAVVAPLNVGERAWGTIVFMHDLVDEADLRVLSLFALQLGSAIDLADHFTQLELRTSELDLVHQLAVAGPRTDTHALCSRALELICRTTHSDAALLHRFDAATGEYEMVGDAFGYRGPLVEEYRRFVMPPERLGREPLASRVSELPVGRDSVTAAGFAHLAMIPMMTEGQPMGTVTMARQADVAYSPQELRIAEILGVQTSAFLERARLYEEASRLYRDLKKSYDELARTQAELVRHERLAALGELAAVMAHEVRNPLGVIFNSLTTLKRLIKPTGDADMLLNMVGEEADRLNRIVGDLLDFVRPYELVKKPIAIEPVVVSAVDAASQALATSNVKVVTEFSAELPPFPADSHMLKQAMVNLVVNALQAMPRGGTVNVKVSMERRPDGAWLRIDVCDEGVGLSPRAAEKMFQPFFTTKATGTGLGLAVVKRIVDGHFGEVVATPNGGGKGTTFTVRLPPSSEREAGGMTPPSMRAAPRP
jgi:signal transduction histidine kinase